MIEDAGSMLKSVALIATKASPNVANQETDVAIAERYVFGMITQWLNEALATSGMKQAELARLLTERLGRSIDRAAVNKMVKGGRKIAGDELLQIAKLTNHPAPTDLVDVGTVPLVGYVGAGAHYFPFEAPGEIDRVPAPEWSTENTVAVEIRGESLGAIFDRWLVYYDDLHEAPTENDINKLCVVSLRDGQVMVKMIRRGQLYGRFNLLSNTEAPIYDADLEWCAVVKNMSPR